MPVKKCIILILPILMLYLTACATNPTDKIESNLDKISITTNYQLYSPKISHFKIIYSWIITPDNALPKQINFGRYGISSAVIVKNFTIISNTGGGFLAYAFIVHGANEEKIGFWHPDGIPRSSENGCNDPNSQYGWVCGGISNLELRRWSSEPTEDEKNNGIDYISNSNYLILSGIKYDVKLGEWEFLNISLVEYREKHYPPTIDI